MSSIEQRLEKLEAALKPSGIVILPIEDGETREACIRRHGYQPNARGLTFITADKWDQLA